MLKNNSSYEKNFIQQRCAKAASAFSSLTKYLWSTPIAREVKLRIYLSAISLIMMNRSETWAAKPTVMAEIDCVERKLLCYFWPRNVTMKIFTRKQVWCTGGWHEESINI
ncbi:hypothetical protein RB195_023221 [Necator americanus]|uniref:Uncharacterized protein n=1 Tax=Necator americanus TaxID=51031 RepID=A0ABR1EIK8_NECAM